MGTYRQSMNAVMILFLVMNSIAVLARIYCRVLLVNAFGWDDAFIILAFLGYSIGCGFGFAAIYYGFADDDGVSMDEIEYYPNADKVVEYYYNNQLALYISSGVVKIAIALVLYRLATNIRNQAILVLAICVVVVWTCVTTVFAMDMCAADGAASYAGYGICGGVGYFRMISNIFIDYFFALYPIPMLWRSTLSTHMKLVVCGLLGLGIIASAATIAKLVILVRLLSTPTGYQQDWLHYQLLIWADAELGLAIFCSSVAALRPLIRVMGGHPLPNINQMSDTPVDNTNRTADANVSDQLSLATQPKRRDFVARGMRDEEYELTSVETLNEDRRIMDERRAMHERNTLESQAQIRALRAAHASYIPG